MKPIKVGNVQVRIYRRTRIKGGEKYTQFDVADYSTGKRKFISFADEQKAKDKATDIANKLNNRDGAVLTLTNDDRLTYLRSLENIKPTGLTLEAVTSQFAEAHKRLAGRSLLEAVSYFIKQHPPTLPKRTVKETASEMLQAKKAEGLSKRHVGDLEMRLDKFADDFQCQLSGVNGAQIREWIQGLRTVRGSKDVSNRSRNNFRLAIQTLFSFGKSRGYLPRDWDELSSVPVWKTSEQEIEIFTPEEMATLLSMAPENLVPFLAIGAFAGLRSAEIERLTFAKNINLQKGYITIGADIAKTNSRRLVPITPNLKEWLLPYAKNKGPVVTLANVANALVRLVESTQPPKDPDRPDAKREPAVAWKHNGLRHSFCSYRLADVKSAAQVALEAGNSPQMIFKFYRELVTEEQAKAWFSITPSTAANVIKLKTAVNE